MNRKNDVKYRVSAQKPFGSELCESFYTDEPIKAIEKWFELGRKYPLCANIQAKEKGDALLLLKTGVAKVLDVRKWYDDGCPYKWEWISDGMMRGLKENCHDFQFEYDSVEPFTMG